MFEIMDLNVSLELFEVLQSSIQNILKQIAKNKQQDLNLSMAGQPGSRTGSMAVQMLTNPSMIRNTITNNNTTLLHYNISNKIPSQTRDDNEGEIEESKHNPIDHGGNSPPINKFMDNP